MNQKKFKFLTIVSRLVILVLFSFNLSAEVFLTQENNSTHLRISFPVSTDKVTFEREENKVLVKSEDMELVSDLGKAFISSKFPDKYITSVEVRDPDEKNNIPYIAITLSSDNLESFNFYREREGKYHLDIWPKKQNTTEVTKAASVEVKEVPKPVVASKTKKELVVEKAKDTPKEVKVPDRATITMNTGYRDFRYGTPFIWNYKPLNPELKQVIDLSSKSPDEFYNIENRKNLDDEKEAHIQLTINLYRKANWGLMYKSIKLYEDKYGDDSNVDINEFLKANAILKENLFKGNREPVKMAINMLNAIAQRTPKYEMRRAIYKYLITYYDYNTDYVNGLQTAKRFYVDSKENFDYEETPFAAEGILYNLAMLNQTAKIEEVLKEKTIVKILPAQILHAYQLYTLLKNDKPEDVVRVFEEKSKSYVKPIHRGILFNVAEAYFRLGKYEEAIKNFDEFIANYSHVTRSADARLRIALCYDILDKDVDQVKELYKNAINRSQDPAIRFEAQLRYVGINNLRNTKVQMTDKETRVFLENPFPDNKIPNKELTKLLWLTRLRILITDQLYAEALTYLQAIPVGAMKPTDVRVFESDGAEVIFGIIFENYLRSDFSNVIRYYETFKDKFVSKVAKDPMVNFLVAKSYLKLGLVDGFDTLIAEFRKIKDTPIKTYPNWVERPNIISNEELLSELEIIKFMREKNWSKAGQAVEAYASNDTSGPKSDFYRGVIFYNLRDFNEGIKAFEKFLSDGGDKFFVDQTEKADFLEAYTGCLYESGQADKFLKIADALNITGTKIENTYLDKVLEKIEYLAIELYSGKTKKISPDIIKKVDQFKMRFDKSIYKGRVELLKGQALMVQDRVKEATQLLNEIITDEKIPAHIKEMARSELSMVKIRLQAI